MGKFLKFRLFAVFLVALAIAIFGYYLRFQKFDSFPPIGDTQDEVKSAFCGISLIYEGKPSSWSWFEDYKNFSIQRIRGDNFRIVTPWFEDPPLFSLISGGYAISKGMTTFEKVNAGILRYPMLKVAALNIFLLFTLCYLIAGGTVAVLASLIFATEPTMVLGSRMPLAENLVVTAVLSSLILFTLYIKKQSRLALVGAAIIGASAFLMKSTGVFAIASLIFLALSYRRWKAAIFCGAVFLVVLAIWLLYGAYYDWSLFLKIVSVESGRELFHPSTVINLFAVFRIGETAMSSDGWLIWGWIAIVLYSFFKKDNKDLLSKLVLPVTVGSYLVFYSIMSGHSKGWYRFPFYPFLAWASAAVFLEILKKPKFLASFFFISLAVFFSYTYGTGGDRWNLSQIKVFQIFVPLVFASFMFYQLFEDRRLKIVCQVILILAFSAAIFFNTRTILFFQDNFWYH